MSVRTAFYLEYGLWQVLVFFFGWCFEELVWSFLVLWYWESDKNLFTLRTYMISVKKHVSIQVPYMTASKSRYIIS